MSRRRWLRWGRAGRRGALAGLVLIALALVFARPADAAVPFIGDCKNAPEVSRPDAGLAGWIGGKPPPDPAKVGDPFAAVAPPVTLPPGAAGPPPPAPPPSANIVDKYGYGGLAWSTYDLGCGGDARDPVAATMNSAANLVMWVPIFVVSTTGALTAELQNPTFMATFDPLLASAAPLIESKLFLPLMALTIAATGVLVIWTAKKGALSKTMGHAGWLLFLCAASAYLLGGPVKAAGTFDDGVGWAGDKVTELFAGNAGPLASVGPTHRLALYDQWVAGVLGDSDSAVAKHYGPLLFQATTMSWDEARRADANAEEAKTTVTRKQEDFKRLAAEIEEKYPDRYLHLKGQRGENRAIHALLAVVAGLGSCLFILLAGISMVIALFTIRVFVLAFPLAAIVGGFPSQRRVVLKLWDQLASAIANALVCGFAAGLASLLVGAALNAPGQSVWLTFVLVIVIQIVLWRLTKPYRTFIPDGIGKALAKLGLQAGATYIGAKAGTQAGQAPAPLPPPPPPRRYEFESIPLGPSPIKALSAGGGAIGPGRPAALGAGARGPVPATTANWIDPETARFAALGLQATAAEEQKRGVRQGSVDVKVTVRTEPNTRSRSRSGPGRASASDMDVIDTDIVIIDGHEIYMPRNPSPGPRPTAPLALVGAARDQKGTP